MTFCFPANIIALKPKADYCRLVRETRIQLHRTCQGFSLLEVLIALCIIAIVLTSVYRLQAQSIDLHDVVRFQSMAPFLAEKKMAAIEAAMPDATADSGSFEGISPELIWSSSIEGIEGFADSQGRPTLVRITISIQQEMTGDVYTVQTCRSVASY